mgnify:CR=1 FL=1
MEANGGAVPTDMLDGMSGEQLGDVLDAVEAEVAQLRCEIEAERKRVEDMPDGPEKEAALKKLAEDEAHAKMKAEEARKIVEQLERKRKRN